jgi:hypothetical protein
MGCQEAFPLEALKPSGRVFPRTGTWEPEMHELIDSAFPAALAKADLRKRPVG